jgi:hypothetical protein
LQRHFEHLARYELAHALDQQFTAVVGEFFVDDDTGASTGSPAISTSSLTMGAARYRTGGNDEA